MKINSTLAILTMAALSAPVVVQAQDPMTAYKQVTELVAAGRGGDAVKLCDQVIQTYGNPKSRVAAQFIHLIPFFYYQKGDILFRAKEYAKAYETFKKMTSEATFKDKAIIARAREQVKPNGYDPMMTMAKFYTGYSLFQMAVGNPPKVAGDPAKFAEAIPELEAYLKMYEAGKVSAQEKKAKLDGSICFLLMQAYILKQNPDFQKAGEYLEKSRTARAPLSDEMAMGGLMSVVKVALQNPQYIEWCYRIVSANPESFDLGPTRMAPYISNMLSNGGQSVQIGQKFLQAGDTKAAFGAFRTANMFYGLVPDPNTVNQSISAYLKHMKLGDKAKLKIIPDLGLGIKHNPGNYKAIRNNYKKFSDSKKYPEVVVTLQSANIGNLLGSKRLMKAGYHIVVDRYPDFHNEKNGKLKSQKDQNLSTYAQLCRATGDDALADSIEKTVNLDAVDKDSRYAAIVAKMSRCVNEEAWEDAIAAANEVMETIKDKQNANYVAALVTRLSSNYKLKKYDVVIQEGTELLEDKDKPLESAELKPELKRTYTTQANFFVLHAYHEIKAADAAERKKNLDTCLNLCQKYLTDFADGLDNDSLAPNVYYFAIDSILGRMASEDDAKKAEDRKLALKYCGELTKKWPNHALTPVTHLIGGQILTNPGVVYKNDAEENTEKDRGLVMFENAYKSALARNPKDFNIASEALYLLVSYAPDFTREGEDEKGKAARLKEYEDTFWSQVYPEENGTFTRAGNSNALKLSATALRHASSSKDAKVFDAALTKAAKIIASEAKYGMEKKVNDPELEKAINVYYSSYVDGNKLINKKELSMQEKIDYFKAFPGVPKENLYASAILRMCSLKAMNEEQMNIRRNKGLTDDQRKAQLKALQDKVAAEMEGFTRDYRPDDLSNYICLQVGTNLFTDAENRFKAGSLKEDLVDTILTYYDKILQRGGDLQAESKLGRAKILALSSQDARKSESANLFKELAACNNPTVATAALVGVTRLNMQNKDYKAVVQSAENYVSRTPAKAARPESVEMHTMFAQALAETGDVNRALQVYLNIFNGNMGAVAVSAPACRALMELYWNRNKAASGDRKNNTFKPSDHWVAWNTGDRYIRGLKNSGIDQKIQSNPDERDAFRAVEELVKKFNDASVQREEADNKAYARASKK